MYVIINYIAIFLLQNSKNIFILYEEICMDFARLSLKMINIFFYFALAYNPIHTVRTKTYGQTYILSQKKNCQGGSSRVGIVTRA